MSYSTYTKDRVLPTIPIINTHTSYMKVEDVLRYLNIINKTLPINQFKLGEMGCHFFKCSDIAGRIGDREFRVMECDVVQFLIEDK